MLYQDTRDRVEYRFDTRIAALEQTDDAVHVTLTDGTVLPVDLVVGADGPHSAVRRMVFGPEELFGKAGLAFRSEPLTYDRRDLGQQRKLLAADRFAGVGWHPAELISAAAQADDFYFDAFAQVHMATWSKGRVTLCGDAGYCASPLSGMGTSLALVGAYVLAGELGPASGFD